MGRCGFGPERSARRLVRSGIALLVLGHLNLVLGAVVHGAVLRHVARPDRHAAAEYVAANIIAVGSGFLSVVAGVVALLVSRPLFHPALPWGLLLVALANALLSGACCVGLALAASLTVASGGRLLLAGCNSSALARPDARAVMTHECPFDTTRIYDTALALWLPSLAMAAAEAGLSVWCCLASLALCGLRPCTASSKAAKLRGPEEATPERGCGGEPHPQRHPLLGMEAGRR